MPVKTRILLATALLIGLTLSAAGWWAVSSPVSESVDSSLPRVSAAGGTPAPGGSDIDAALSATVPAPSPARAEVANRVSPFVYEPVDLTRSFRLGSAQYSGRHLAVTRYGGFIRDLPLSPGQKRRVRNLLAQVLAYNSWLTGLFRNSRISEEEYRQNRLSVADELSSLLDPAAIAGLQEWEARQNDEFRAEQAAARQRANEYRLDDISGLTPGNQDLFITKLIEANGGESARNQYDMDVLERVRNELDREFNADQMEVIDIFIEAQLLQQQRLQAIAQGDVYNDELYRSLSLTTARVNVNKQYGEFIRDLPLAPVEKQEVRALMVEVDVHNANYMEQRRRNNYQNSNGTMALRRLDDELARLDPLFAERFNQYETRRREQLAANSRAMQQSVIDSNLERLSGLSDANRTRFIKLLADTEPQPRTPLHYQLSTLEAVRGQLAAGFDEDQLEIIDIYLAEERDSQRRLAERREARSGR